MSSEAVISATERRRFTVDDVLRMVDAGIFGEEDRIELVNGEILMVPPQGPEHRSLKDELHARLLAAYGKRKVHILDQGPLVAGEEGLPEPDLAVVEGAPRDYLERHPTGGDTVVVIELSSTSQDRDRRKATDYARGGVPLYWLLDLPARRLDVYSDPDPARHRYRTRVSLFEDDDVTLPLLATTWRVASMLP